MFSNNLKKHFYTKIVGIQVKDFSSFSDAIFTLLRTILGDFDFHAIEQVRKTHTFPKKKLYF